MKSRLNPHLRLTCPAYKLMAALLGFLIGVGSYYVHLSYFYDASALAGERFCMAHGALMRKEQVPIVYGMPIKPVGYDEVREELFPNAHRVFQGGCVRGKKKHVSAWVCDRCRAARLGWLKERNFLAGESRYGELLNSR